MNILFYTNSKLSSKSLGGIEALNLNLAQFLAKTGVELAFTPIAHKIIKFLKSIDKKFVVIESSELLDNPEKILSQWCSKINIKFDKSMLKWEKGNHPNDGIWWKHWYDNVINTNKFSRVSFWSAIL